MPPLSILIWLPLACGLLGAIVSLALSARGRSSTSPGATSASQEVATQPAASTVGDLAARIPGLVVLVGAIATLALSIGYIVEYHPGTAGLQHVTNVVWIATLGIHYKLGIDGLNVFLVALTTLLFVAALVAANLRGTRIAGSADRAPFERPRLFYFYFALAETAVLGAFLAQDLALFVAFFDLMLIPFYFLTGGWGEGPRRVQATTKLVIYTLVGSLLMLAAAVATGVLAAHQHGTPISFELSALRALPLGRGSQEWIFLCFAAAFLVKMPAFPLHGWMPDGYSAMPVEVLMVFSGVLSKVGAYGFLAIVLPLFPAGAAHFQMLMLLIALASILYGSVIAFTQTDARMIAGYSSVAQLGFITLGIFSLDPKGAQGALLQMINHGLVVAPLFFIIALLSERAGGTRDIRRMGGIAFRAPVFASLFLIVSLATLAMPGSSNFVGEFLILLGVFQTKMAIALIAFAGVVMASVYALRAFIRTMHNRVGTDVTSREISFSDGLVLVPVIGVIFFFALYPQLALKRSEASTKAAVADAHAAATTATLTTATLTTAPGPAPESRSRTAYASLGLAGRDVAGANPAYRLHHQRRR